MTRRLHRQLWVKTAWQKFEWRCLQARRREETATSCVEAWMEMKYDPQRWWGTHFYNEGYTNWCPSNHSPSTSNQWCSEGPYFHLLCPWPEVLLVLHKVSAPEQCSHRPAGSHRPEASRCIASVDGLRGGSCCQHAGYKWSDAADTDMSLTERFHDEMLHVHCMLRTRPFDWVAGAWPPLIFPACCIAGALGLHTETV